MKKTIAYLFIFSLIISGCGTHTAQGALIGSQVGTTLGSAIGSLSGGWRGSNKGTIIGMVGGAVVGGAIGNACDKQKQQKEENIKRNKYYPDESSPCPVYAIEVNNIVFYDANDNGTLTAGEFADLEFDITNTSSSVIYKVHPILRQTGGTKGIEIVDSHLIDKIEPQETVKYSFHIRTSKKLKDGTVTFRLSVFDSINKQLAPNTDFEVETKR